MPPPGSPGYLVVPAGNNLGPWLVGNDPTADPGNNVTLEQFPALPVFKPWLTAQVGLWYLDLTGVANRSGSCMEQVLATTPGLYHELFHWAGSANSPFHQTRIRFLNSISRQDACLLDTIGFDLAGVVPTTSSTWGSVKRLFDR